MNRLTSIFFLFVFCFSITSFSAELHYCKGELKDISIIGHADCGTCNNNDSKCKMHKNKKCCKTEIISHEGEEDCLNSSYLITNNAVSPLILTVIYDYSFFEGKEIESTVFKSYSPPDYQKDIVVLFRSFLI